MNIQPDQLSTNAMYHWMVGLITPRPIAWVSTMSKTGVANLAPFSFFNGVGASPPCLMFCPVNSDTGDPKDTLRNIHETGQFAVNLVTEDVVEAMNLSAGGYEPDIDEFDVTSLEKSDCQHIDVPKVAGAAATFECTLMQATQLGFGPGGANLVIGRIVGLTVKDELVSGGRVVADKLLTVGRMGGRNYCRTRDTFELPRP